MKSVRFAVVLTIALAVSSSAFATGQYYNRPIPLGVCGSNMRTRCGGVCDGDTLGSTVRDSSGTQYILSNNHVIGDSNGAVAGDNITQPDCVGSSYTVAHFTKFVPLYTNQNNYSDAAVAKVVSGDVSTNDYILGIGPVSGVAPCSVGEYVQKQGCCSGLTTGQIVSCLAQFYLTNPCLGSLPYVEQIQVNMVSPVCPGDSGAVFVSLGSNPQALGLLFAQNPAGSVAYANWIGNVLQELNMSGMAAPTGAITPEVTAPPTALDVQDREAGHVVTLYAPGLMKIPGVWGVQDYLEPDGRIVIRVDVEKITPEIERQVPKTLGTFPVVIFEGPPPIESGAGRSCPGRATPAAAR